MITLKLSNYRRSELEEFRVQLCDIVEETNSTNVFNDVNEAINYIDDLIRLYNTYYPADDFTVKTLFFKVNKRIKMTK